MSRGCCNKNKAYRCGRKLYYSSKKDQMILIKTDCVLFHNHEHQAFRLSDFGAVHPAINSGDIQTEIGIYDSNGSAEGKKVYSDHSKVYYYSHAHNEQKINTCCIRYFDE
jgi:hypothetical protein